jgi:hypothetical protein
MRITIAHNRSKAEIMKSVDQSFDEISRGDPAIPVSVAMKEKSWNGSVLSFVLAAKMGFISTPIKGTVEVTDHDVIIDADLGLLGKLIPEKTAREMFGERFKGLLN